jgi:exosome complex exonuclease RRP6
MKKRGGAFQSNESTENKRQKGSSASTLVSPSDDLTHNFDRFLDESFELTARIHQVVQSFDELNDVDEYKYYALTHPDTFQTPMSYLGHTLLTFTEDLVRHDNPSTPFSSVVRNATEQNNNNNNNNSTSGSVEDGVVRMENAEDAAMRVSEHFDFLVDYTDAQLERIDVYADRCLGLVKDVPAVVTDDTIDVSAAADQQSSASLLSSASSASSASASGYGVFHASNIGRPQLRFADAVDNSPTPFVPKIVEKPNAMRPLDADWLAKATRARDVQRNNTLLVRNDEEGDARPKRTTLPADVHAHLVDSLGVSDASSSSAATGDALESALHPYAYELEHFEYQEWQLKHAREKLYDTLERTPLRWVRTKAQLDELMRTLSNVDELAIDLEHHDYRSFQGFVCLMQVSTRDEDYLIDTLELREHLGALNPVFTDPRVVKVLHGCDKDVVWMQRDFGLYLVNVFDTGQASRVLDFPYFSLAYLLKHYCSVVADKQYQLADWRVRPLPPVMERYAREDTHYLLYIYDRMRNELIVRGNTNNNLLLAVLGRGRQLAAVRYEKMLLTPSSHLELYQRNSIVFSTQQMHVFAQLFRWRDSVARDEDESTRFVLPNHMLFHVAELMPTTTDALYACCSPVPSYLRLYGTDVVDIIAQAKKDALEGTTAAALAAPIVKGAAAPPAHQVAHQQHQQHQQRHQQQQRAASEPVYRFADAGLIVGSLPRGPLSSSERTAAPTDGGVLNADELFVRARWIPTSARDDDDSDDAAPTIRSAPENSGFSQSAAPASSAASLFAAGTSSNDALGARVAHVSQGFALSSIAAPAAALLSGNDNASPNARREPPPSILSCVDDDSLDKKVPRSMAEIYQLSNLNRKRNKEKKKLKEGSAQRTPSSPVRLIDDDIGSGADASSGGSGGESSKSSGSKHSFMRDIGWIEPDAPSPPPKEQQQQQQRSSSSSSTSASSSSSSSSKSRSSRRKAGKQNFTPFDYSRAAQQVSTDGSASSRSSTPNQQRRSNNSNRSNQRNNRRK